MKQYNAFVNAQLVLYPLVMWLQGDFMVGRWVEGWEGENTEDRRKVEELNVQHSTFNVQHRIKEIWLSSKKVGDFIKVLRTKPWSLTLYGLRHVPA